MASRLFTILTDCTLLEPNLDLATSAALAASLGLTFRMMCFWDSSIITKSFLYVSQIMLRSESIDEQISDAGLCLTRSATSPPSHVRPTSRRGLVMD